MGVAAILWNPMLALIALFVWMAAGQEAAMEQLKTSLRGILVSDAMVVDFQTLESETALGAAAMRLQTGFQHDFPIVRSGHVVGMLTRADILRGLAQRDASTPVAQLMHRQVSTAGDGEELEGVLARLPQDGSPVLVMHDEVPVGLLDPEHVNQLIAARGPSVRGNQIVAHE